MPKKKNEREVTLQGLVEICLARNYDYTEFIKVLKNFGEDITGMEDDIIIKLWYDQVRQKLNDILPEKDYDILNDLHIN